jgi:hypothetical protein
MTNLPLDYIDVVDVMPRPVAGLCQRVPAGRLSSFITQAIPAVMDQLNRVGIRPTGPPGPHATLPGTYRKLTGWFADRNLVLSSLSWEEHLAGPDVAGESGCHTRVVFPLG